MRALRVGSQLKRSLLLQNETVAMLTEDAQAQLSLAMLLDRQLDQRKTRKLRARCEAHIQVMHKSSLEFITMRARALDLQLAWLDGERRTALQAAEALVQQAMIAQMLPFAHALNMLRALMIGLQDELARELLQSATEWYASESVVNPKRLASTLCPLLVFLPEQ